MRTYLQIRIGAGEFARMIVFKRNENNDKNT